jgi:endonuclease/exonuclease/phosphatase family metal-dependent hydrolase
MRGRTRGPTSRIRTPMTMAQERRGTSAYTEEWRLGAETCDAARGPKGNKIRGTEDVRTKTNTRRSTEAWGRGAGSGAGERNKGKKRKKQNYEKVEDRVGRDISGGKRRKYVKKDATEERKGEVKREGLGIGTWNVRTLNSVGKLEEVKSEMKRYGLSILGVSEARWKGQGDLMSDGVRIIYSGGEEEQRGVAIMLDEEVAKRVTEIEQCSDRLIMVRVSATPVDMIIIQVYMPTTDHEDDEIEEMYEQIESMIKKQKGNINVIIMGDFNASVGEGSDEKVIGKYGLGNRNERGQMLSSFCKKNQLVVTNTWFQQGKRRRYTWKSPADRKRYQLDYILVRQRYRNSVKCSKSWPGADVYSDHNLVAMKMDIKLKTLRRGKRVQKWNIERLKNNSIPFQRSVEEAVGKITRKGMNGNQRWIDFKGVILGSAREEVGYEKKEKIRKPWITEDMIRKMEERRKWKNRNDEYGRQRYKQLNNELRREAEKAKREWWSRECDELEKLYSEGRYDLLYAKVAKLTWKKSVMSKNVRVTDGAGNTVTEPEEVRERWRQYIESLYDKDGKPKKEDLQVEEGNEVEEDDRGPEVLRSEILLAISEMKEGKAVGLDEIPSEMLKSLGEKAIQELCEICQNIYEEGKWPEDFTRTAMIPLPKKNNAKDFGDYRTISLICHASKIMLKVLTKRIEMKTKHLIGRNQFGFRKGCGTRDAVGVMRTLCERSLEHGNEVYICFVDFEKAFDRVDWIKLFDILKNLRIDWKDRRLLQDLYMRQEAVIRIADGESQPGIIGRGVRQGCPISPLLFSIYAEVMMIEVLEDVEEGVLVGGQLVSDVRFADDQGMVAGTETGLQRIMNKLNDTAKNFSMKINVQKTKAMVVRWNGGGVVNITVDGQRIEQVKSFKYLGSIITEDGRSHVDVKARIAMAKDAFNKRKELLTKGLSMTLKKRMVKVLVWPIVLYGCETWTLLQDEINRLEALEAWLWRGIEKIKWMDKISTERVFEMVNEERCLIRIITQRKKNWIGHVLRGNGLLRDVIEGRMVGKRRIGKPREGMLSDLKREISYRKEEERDPEQRKKSLKKAYVTMKRLAVDRGKWREWCHKPA